ncbi:MAG TPA: choice-of-anchor I family protein, partial [Gemmatimonadaceae bacterium]|nr:choice-of-anchor I family protein [Gemmatimonadaceae bacterium]
GEPSDDDAVDPPGPISVIDVRNPAAPVVRTATFDAFDADVIRRRGVRIAREGATAAQDLEPEYVAVAPDGRTAWVTLQENNALAVVNIERAEIVDVLPLGEQDHAQIGFGFDASDRDGGVNIRPWPVRSLFQPDAIAAWDVDGVTYLVHANEGDTRAWGGRDELVRAATLPLDTTVFSDSTCGGACADSSRLGRLHVFADRGRNATTGRYDTLVMSGARSFTVRRADGTLVWDSGDAIEQRTAALAGVPFNGDDDDHPFDVRSDDRGPEPEGLVLGRVAERTIVFVALERTGGVMAWDVTVPDAPTFVTYVNTLATHGDRSPEGLAFVPATQSPTGRALLIVGFEVSGTTVVFEVVPAATAP